MPKKAGWEAVLYYGTAGSQAATQVTKAKDINYECPMEYADTTVRGAGTLIPIKDYRPAMIDAKITWTMVLDTTDTALVALLAAATTTTPTAKAIYYKSYASGTGFDGDCYLSVKNGSPLNGDATYDLDGGWVDGDKASKGSRAGSRHRLFPPVLRRDRTALGRRPGARGGDAALNSRGAATDTHGEHAPS